MYRALAALLVLAPSAAALATTVRPAELAELAREASLVVVATPGERQAFRTEGRIQTRVRVSVEQTWLGKSPGAQLDVVLLGGVLGEIGQRVDGEARLVERAVLFLVPDTSVEGWRVLAMAQGEWPIAPTSGVGTELVAPTAEPRPARLVTDLAALHRRVLELAGAK